MTEGAGHPTPVFGAATGRFLGWWFEDDLVWRDEAGDAVGYLEAAYGPWSWSDDPDWDWRGEQQEYALWHLQNGRGVPYGVLLTHRPGGREWAGRFTSSWSGPGRQAIPPQHALAHRTVPERLPDREGLGVTGLRDPEDCTWHGEAAFTGRGPARIMDWTGPHAPASPSPVPSQ